MEILQIPWDEFRIKLTLLSRKIDSYELEIEDDPTINEVNEIYKKFEDWKNSCGEYLTKSLGELSDISIQFRQISNYYNPNSSKENLNRKKELLKKDFFRRRKYLERSLKFLSVLDYTIYPEKRELLEKRNFLTKDKLNIILNKLYEINDNNSYSIKEILEGNGITIKRDNEVSQLVKKLVDEDLIKASEDFEKLSPEQISAQITSNGELQIESDRKAKDRWTEEDKFNYLKYIQELDERLQKLEKEGEINTNVRNIIIEQVQLTIDDIEDLQKSNAKWLVKGLLREIFVSLTASGISSDKAKEIVTQGLEKIPSLLDHIPKLLN